MTVVSLTRFTPLERADAIPWTQARILEALNVNGAPGTFTLIDTLSLSPLDTDPANPLTRDLTTTHGTVPDGWYQVVWVDGAAGQSAPTQPLHNVPELAGGIRPSVTEVASLIRARTKVSGGKEMGTFNTLTRPTGAEVEDLIDDAEDEILGKVQPIDSTMPAGSAYNAPGSAYERRIRSAVKVYAAILIELSYWPEQIHTGQSPVATWQQLYDERIRALISEGETGKAEGMGEGASGAGDAPADAAWGGFPDAAPGALVGWASRF